MICYLYPEPVYVFFTSGVPGLLYYSHIPTTIFALGIGLYVFFSAKELLLNRLLFYITLCFSLWVLLSLFAWTNIHGDFILFIWPYFGILSALLSLLSIYFVYVFLFKNDIPFWLKVVFFTLLAPLFIFAPTDLNITGFNITYCDPYGFEGVIFKYYYIFVSLLSLVAIPLLLIKKYLAAERNFKKQIVLLGTGVELFLLTFFFATFVASYLSGIGAITDSSIELYGLFGVLIFVSFIGILITKFDTFRVSLLASQALVVTLVILIGSQFTFTNSRIADILTAITLVLTTTIGIILVKSVIKEIRQREEIQSLATSLAKANERLKEIDKLKSEFVSIASHQLRAPLTSIRGYASMLVDGSYGKIPPEATEALSRIEESAKYMAYSVEDYLNVSRIESGNMKYNNNDFNLREEVEHVCDDLRPQALRRGLVLLFRTELRSKGIINADIGKTIQIIQNLINNSIKYTKAGSIKVLVRDDIVRRRIFVDIEDTGIGMNEDTKDRLFQKFERAKSANAVDNGGTGLGLFVASQMAKGMGGTITAHSEGEGKGSRFTVEFPLAM